VHRTGCTLTILRRQKTADACLHETRIWSGRNRGIRAARFDAMSIDDFWHKNAVIYCLDVEKYQDANGDGVGDFEGLMRRLDYLAGLGVTCVWLQPFYVSPNRDNGYDVADYYNVHDKHGSLGDFVNFMNHAKALGIRVIVDLVVNHSSVDCPWFRAARADKSSVFRDWYVWADERPKHHREGIVFPGQQTTTWTLDRKAGQ
jgi:maltose alpha-D-glucosyltransferase/alpha-amylase